MSEPVRTMAFGESDDVETWPIIEITDEGLCCDGQVVTDAHIRLMARSTSRYLVADARAYGILSERAARFEPAYARRLTVWRHLAYNPGVVVMTETLSRLWSPPFRAMSLRDWRVAFGVETTRDLTAYLMSSPAAGVDRVMQEAKMTILLDTCAYARADFGSELDAVTAARCYRAFVTVQAAWESICLFDPLYRSASLVSGDVVSASIVSLNPLRLNLSQPCKLKEAPVYLAFESGAVGEASITHIDVEDGELMANLRIAKPRTVRIGADYETTRAELDHAAEHDARIAVFDNTFASTKNLDQVRRWSLEESRHDIAQPE